MPISLVPIPGQEPGHCNSPIEAIRIARTENPINTFPKLDICLVLGIKIIVEKAENIGLPG
jgi:hypothetical protein